MNDVGSWRGMVAAEQEPVLRGVEKIFRGPEGGSEEVGGNG
jgi:hypothetical protein